MKNLLPQYILRQYVAKKLNGSFEATTMFVDISGFTPLTESLMRHGTEGAEILSEILDSVFAPMVAQVYERGGEISHFAGDAFTAIFIDNQTEKVAALAHEICDSFKKSGVYTTKFGNFQLNIRIGLSVGEVAWGIIGDRHKTFYFRGTAIDQAAAAQQKAQPQEIFFDSMFAKKLLQENVLTDTESINVQKEILANIDLPTLKTFLPEAVINFNGKGEFREVVSVFISFDNVHTRKDLEAYSVLVLDQFDSFGGYFKELDFGDKGGLMVGFWGAPTSFENNLARALECIIAIKDELSHLQVHHAFKFRAGVTAGIAYAGMVGGIERHQYAVVGSCVNLAARLALQANWDETLVDMKVLHAKSFEFEEKGKLHYKGFGDKVPTFKLIKKKTEERPFFSGSMVGRDTELHQLLETASVTLMNQSPGIVYIWGEPGIGKSRLTFEVKHQIENLLKVRWVVCQSDQILRKPFNPFIYHLKNFFKQSVEQSLADNFASFELAFENLVRSLPESAYTEGAELIRTRSVLAALVGLNYSDTLWEQLDARGRYDNTIAAIENFVLTLAQINPLVIELEDAHWLDNDSHTLLENFIRRIRHTPILIINTMRYDDEGGKKSLFSPELLKNEKIKVVEIDLNVLSPEGLKQLAESKLKGSVHTDFSEMLWRTTNGNPFYIEQILAYFSENNLLQSIDNQWTAKDTNVRISTSISAILTARIDRLSSILKETVKAAAVIGREFELPVLSEVILQHDEYIRRNGNAPLVLREQVQSAEKGQIWRAMNELRYIFRHSLLREAVYDMQLKTRLRELHFMIAKAIEKVYNENIEQRYVDLAFHYEQAEVKSKTLEYLHKAADFARRNYQNQQALDFYDRLLTNIENETERVKILIKKGEVLQLVGRWYDSEIAFHEALFKTAATGDINLKGRAHNALGTLLMLKGGYEEARPYLEKAASYFEQISDFKGIARTYGNLGNLYFRQGEYSLAKDYFVKSIHISRENDLPIAAQIVSNLGLTYMNEGNYTEGIKTQLEELEIATKHNDLAGAATLWVNLGIVYSEKGDETAALNGFEKGLELCQLLGNKQFTSIALGCIGNIWRIKGNFEKADEYLQEDLNICNELGDRQGIAIAHELIGKLGSTKGEFYEAISHFELSLKLCRQINYQKGIAKALYGLGEVYSYHNEFLKSIKCCDEAAVIARKIHNKLILGQCLVEKALVLIKAGDLTNAKILQTEILEVSDSLGNEKLRQQVDALLKKL